MKNIDTILVNPSDMEKMKKALLENGLEKYANMIVSCDYITKGRALACCTERTIYVDASWLEYWRQNNDW